MKQPPLNRPSWSLAILFGVLWIVGCTDAGNTGSGTSKSASKSKSAITQSCFQTSTGLTCIDTPNGPTTTATDVDGDGTADPFVCANNADDDDADTDQDTEAGDDNELGTSRSRLSGHGKLGGGGRSGSQLDAGTGANADGQVGKQDEGEKEA